MSLMAARLPKTQELSRNFFKYFVFFNVNAGHRAAVYVKVHQGFQHSQSQRGVALRQMKQGVFFPRQLAGMADGQSFG